MKKEFADKVVLVAGGVGELGGPVTAGFVERGSKVVVPFISEMKLNTFLADYPELRKSVRFHRVDLCNEKLVHDFVEGIRKREGRIDVLVNLTGGYRGGVDVAESENYDFTDMLNVNFTTVYTVTKAVLPQMFEAGGGKIVNVGSSAGLRGSAGHAPYSIAKSAVIRLTESLADEVKRDGINVNCVLPTACCTSAARTSCAVSTCGKSASDPGDRAPALASHRARRPGCACHALRQPGGDAVQPRVARPRANSREARPHPGVDAGAPGRRTRI